MKAVGLESVETRVRALHLVALWLAICLEVAYFPAVATTLYNLAGGAGGPGSSIGFFRDRYVLPWGIGLGVALTLALLVCARNTRVYRRVWFLAWLVDFVAVTASSAWYFRVIRAAGSFARS